MKNLICKISLPAAFTGSYYCTAYADASQITSGLSSQLQIVSSFVNGDLKTYILSIMGVIALIVGIVQLVRRGFGAQVGYMQIIIEFTVFFICGVLATATTAS